MKVERMTAAQYLDSVIGAKTKQPKQPSKLEEAFADQLDSCGIDYEREVKLVTGRRFRFDFVIPTHKLAIEVQGGQFSNGRHNRNPGPDCEKANLAGLAGWRTLYGDTSDIKSERLIAKVLEAMGK